jgi:drug/metabolite transporter (DMT)-like permease
MTFPESDAQRELRRRLWLGYALSGTGAVLFATKGVLIKLIYAYGLDATALLSIRMALSVPLFAGVGLLHWRCLPAADRPPTAMLGKAALVGVLGYYVSSWLDFTGLETIDAQLERLILFTYPFFVILFGRLLFGKRMTAHALAGAGLSYAGLLVMFAGTPARLAPEVLAGGGLVMVAAMSFALYQLFAFELISGLGATLFTAVALTGAGAAMLVHALIAQVEIGQLPLLAWLLILALVIFATVLPSFIMSAGTARIGAQGTAIVSSVSPIATIALSVAVLGEPFGIPEIVGTALVIGGVAFFTLRESRKIA